MSPEYYIRGVRECARNSDFLEYIFEHDGTCGCYTFREPEVGLSSDLKAGIVTIKREISEEYHLSEDRTYLKA